MMVQELAVQNLAPIEDICVELQPDYCARTGEIDVIQPTVEFPWKAAVYNDVPSGFSIRLYTADRPARITLRGLHIQLAD